MSSIELRKLSFKIAQDEIQAPDPKVKKEVNKYYKECRADGGSQEYCARVAWQIYCENVNPDYEGCTEFGETEKTVGPLNK